MYGRLVTWKHMMLLAAAVAVLITAGCAGSSTPTTSDTHADFFAQLPQMPYDAPVIKATRADVPLNLTGDENWDNSGNVTVDGNSLTVTSAAGRLDWVMYRYNVGQDTTLGDLTINVSAVTGEFYVLVAGYGVGYWRLYGPFTDSVGVGLGSGGDFLSSGFQTYAVVAVYNGAEVTVDDSSLIYDDQAAPPDYLNNMQALFADNCMPCHSTANHTQGIILDTYWNSYENADAALAKALSDHAPSGNAMLTQEQKDMFQAWVDNNEPYGADVTYTNYVSGVTAANCSPCHTGGNSSGGVNFDSYANANSAASLAWTEIKSDGMPPSGPLTGEEKDKWLAWINQGTPE